MTDRPLLLVMATGGGKLYREYLLRSMSRGYRLHLLTGAEPTWERPYLTGWTQLDNMAETIDATELCTAARAVTAREPVHGVFTWDEGRVLQAAKIAAELGLPGGDPEVAMRCRDKLLTRDALAAAGVPQPGYQLATTAAEAALAAERFGYPVVLKPRAMAASLGVVRADTAAQLSQRFDAVRDTTIPGAWRYDSVLVEEYLPDPEVSIDAAVFGGQVHPMFVARKELGFPPYFEEVGHLVDATDPLAADPAVRELLQAAHAALGFTDGMTHTELKLTATGPKVIEVNGRLGGGLIPYLGLRATGVDPGLAAAAVACGRRPELTASRSGAGGVRFFYVERAETTIGEIKVDRRRLPTSVEQLVAMVEPGTVVSPPPRGTAFGRIAFATAFAETAAQCREALARAGDALLVTPVGQAAGSRS